MRTRASLYEWDARDKLGRGIFAGDQCGLASGFVPGSTRCWRRVSEQAHALCAAGTGDNFFFTSRVPAMSVGLQDEGQIPQTPSSHRLALSCVPGAGAGCCRGCCLLYAARVSTVTGNLSGITGECSWACEGSQSK